MIQATEVTIVYRGDGKQTAFSFPYPYRTSGDIHGYLVDEMGMETEIVSNYRYDTVENTYIYPVQGDPLTADMSIRLSRETPLQNNVPGDVFFALSYRADEPFIDHHGFVRLLIIFSSLP